MLGIVTRPLRLAVFGALLLISCSGPDLGFGVALTLRFDSTVSDPALASVDTIEIDASGGESYTKTISLDRAAMRVERTLYRPGQATRMLELAVIARDGHGVVIASGTTAVTLTAGETSSATIELTAPASGDEGLFDLSSDGARTDGGTAPTTPTFVSATSMPTAAGPTVVAIGDVNGDALPDIAVGASDGGKVQLFFATSAGHFGTLPNVEIAVTHPTAIVIVDFDHDGDGDVLVTDSSSGNVYYCANAGQGSFPTSQALTSLTSADSIVVADFDHDSQEDVAISSSTQTGIRVYWGGDKTTQLITTSGVLTKLHGADVNADGFTDFLGIEGGDHLVTILDTSATTKRTFGVEDFLSTSGEADVAALALPGATTSPPVLAVDSSGKGSLFANDGGHLSNQTDDVGLPALGPISQLGVADLDGDGKLDVVESVAFGATSSYQTILYAFGGQNTTTSLSTTHTFATEDDPRGFAIGDVDGDGKLDVVLASYGSSTVSVYFTSGTSKIVGAPVIFGQALVSGFDFNGDGKRDVALSVSNSLQLVPGDGTGEFGAATSLVSQGETVAAAVGDLDGNGHIDVAWVTTNSYLEYALDSAGGFGAPQSVQLDSTFVDVAIADVTGDGKLDIVTLDSSFDANAMSRNVSVYAGDGAGNFAPAVGYAADSPVRMQIADVNGDGLLDVVLASLDMKVWTLLGVTGGTLSAAIGSPTTLSSVANLALVDANGDGKLDVVVAGAGAQLLIGAKDGTFSDGGTLSTEHATDVAVALIDRDALPDLCLLVDSRILVAKGTGATFEPSTTYASGANGTRLVLGDYTSDGAADALVYGQVTALLVNSTP